MKTRVRLLDGEFTGKTQSNYVVLRGSSVILSRAGYVELISFNPEFRPAPSDHEDFRTASQIVGDCDSSWSRNGEELTVRCVLEGQAEQLYAAISRII